MTRAKALQLVPPAAFSSPGKQPDTVVVKPGDMHGRVEIITAAQAQRILADAQAGTTTLGQRPVSKAVVADFVDIIKAGEWQPVPPGIVWSVSGEFLNGQHRLSAQVLAGADLPWFVIRNCPTDIFPLIDTEKKRTLVDSLKMLKALDGSDLPNKVSPHLASAARLMEEYEQALQPDAELDLAHWSRWYNLRRQPGRLIKTFQRHPKLIESLSVGYRLHTGRWSAPAVTVWHRLVLDAYPKAETTVNEFVEQIHLGQHIGAGDPAYALRNWHIRGGPATHNADHHRCTRERYLFAIMQAWNAYARRSELKNIHVSGKQPMPTPENVRPAPRREGNGRA